jgi:PPOX class probable F420-dependent enzyme
MNLAEARRTFRDVRVVHVASLLPDGNPHVVPLWFVWLDDAVYVSCRRASTVRRNLERDPRVALEIERGSAWTEQAGALIRGTAELLPSEHAGAKKAMSAWFDKYRSELAGRGFAAYTEQVGEPVVFRVRPERFSSWIHAQRPPGPEQP